MSTMQIVGMIMLATPFVGLFALMVRDMGWRDTLITHGVIAVILLWVFVAVYFVGKA
jgi:hypothetical protein